MTPSIKEKYLELTQALTAYITQEHQKGTWVETNLDNYNYFLTLAAKTSKAQPQRQPQPQPAFKTAPAPLPAPLKANRPKEKHTSGEIKQQDRPAAEENENIATEKLQKNVAPTAESKALPETKGFKRELPADIIESDFNEMRTLFKAKLPNVALTEAILDDATAKAVSLRWDKSLAAVYILTFNELEKEQTLLQNMTLAINNCLAPAKVINALQVEEQKGWEKLLKSNGLKLVIANNYNLHTLPELLKYYREEQNGKQRLANVELYLLSDLSLYIQQPQLKASLWKALTLFFKRS